MKPRGRPRSKSVSPLPGWAARIADARAKAGLTQEGLGDLSGCKQSTITDYESGESEPDIARFELLAKALNVSAGWLAFGGPDNGEPVEGAPTQRDKDDRLFTWAFHQAARLLAEEGIEGDLAYLTAYTRKLMGAAKGTSDNAESKELIRAAVERERAEIRNGLDQIRKNLI